MTTMRTAVLVFLVLAVSMATPGYPAAPAKNPAARKHVFYSDVFTVDRQYRSMEGPHQVREISLAPRPQRKLLWITAFEAVIVEPDSDEPHIQDLMCHINLDYDAEAHRRIFNWKKRVSPRLFSLSQGQFKVEFPEGFALPLMSDEFLSVTTQVLNHNLANIDTKLRYKITVSFVPEDEVETPFKPVYLTSAFGMKLLEGPDGFYGIHPEQEHPGTSCLPGEHAENGSSTGIFADQYGRKFSGHWKVKPGREINHTFVTQQMALEFDTTIHYIAVHVHPFAEYLELRDITADEVVFRSKARGPKRGLGVRSVETFSSKKGIPLYKDHEYELISAYHNTSGVDQDAMATLFLYLLDKEFRTADR